MCTVLFVKTFRSFKGDKDIDLSKWMRMLMYRGRDKYRLAIFDGRAQPFVECESPLHVVNILQSLRGECLVGIFGRATPETEEESFKPLRQPMIAKTKDGLEFVALHHGIYPKAPRDKYDSEILTQILIEDSKKWLDELRHHSSFVYMFAEATAVCKKLVAYSGQLPFAFEAEDTYIVIGTIPHPLNANFIYTKVTFSFTNRIWKIDDISPIDSRGIEIGYSPFYIPFDSVAFPSYSIARVVSLYSGGMDGFIATDHLLRSLKRMSTKVDKLYFLFFDYGQFAVNEEFNAVNRSAKYLSKLHDVQIEVLKEKLNVPKCNLVDKLPRKSAHREAEDDVNYVPYRNMLMLTHAAIICEQLDAQILVTGFNLSEGMVYNDNSPSFYYNIANALQVAGRKGFRISLIAPLLHLTKTEAVKYALRHNLDVENMTFSCYYPQNGRPCNQCGSCILRNTAIERARKLLKEEKAKQGKLDE